MFEIEFYMDSAGNEPIVDYIRKLDAKSQTSADFLERSENDE
jgi:hypothetical protein